MTYSVIQTGQATPSREQLAAAFGRAPGLTAADINTLGKDAYGILLKGSERAQAAAMQEALAELGIQTEMVEDAALPELPAPRQLNKADFSPEGLVIYDLMGRGVPLPWSHFALIAAGRVCLTEFKSEITQQIKLVGVANHPSIKVVTERQTAEEQAQHLLIELLTREPAARYNAVADRPESLLLFQCLGGKRSREPLANLTSFVRELARSAPAAILNYGAYNFWQNHDPSFIYSNKTSFYREISWLLWMSATGRLPLPS